MQFQVFWSLTYVLIITPQDMEATEEVMEAVEEEDTMMAAEVVVSFDCLVMVLLQFQD